MSLSEKVCLKCSSLGMQEDAHVMLLCKVVKKDIEHEANVDESITIAMTVKVHKCC